MRTTVTLDADVESLIRDRVRKTKRPFKFVLNEALRSALRGPANSAGSAPFKVEAKALGLLPGQDTRGMAKTADNLEAEAFLALSRRLEEARRS